MEMFKNEFRFLKTCSQSSIVKKIAVVANGYDETLKSAVNIELLRNLGKDKLKFPFHGSLGKGDVALLNCTAIVNTSNENLTDKNPVSESIFMLAGPDLKEDLQKLKGCRTGEAKLTKGFNLAARFIIHTVGPKYKSRYRTAAESSLYSCYRNVLQLAKSLKEECRSLPYLPADIGNAEGEPVVPERQIRISEKPGAPEDSQEEEAEGLGVDLSFIGSHAFARMEGDIDKQRRLILQGQLSEAALQKQHQRNYNRWLCQARSEDLSDIASLKALYQTGVDNCGRTVMVVVGRNIPVTLIDMDKVNIKDAKKISPQSEPWALLYFIHVMDHIAVKEYVLVYFHTLTSEYNHLDSDFLKKLYDVVDVKYKRNLKAVYFVHPTFRSKVQPLKFSILKSELLMPSSLTHSRTSVYISYLSKWDHCLLGLKDKIHHVDSLHQLFSAISPEQIDFPPFVLEYDARLWNGVNIYSLRLLAYQTYYLINGSYFNEEWARAKLWVGFPLNVLLIDLIAAKRVGSKRHKKQKGIEEEGKALQSSIRLFSGVLSQQGDFCKCKDELTEKS
ncbi:hypothetical protein GH733_018414 [Mirounga leonina]|nr:hypothetical protein GH733_018414 [Mirounga leonina]